MMLWADVTGNAASSVFRAKSIGWSLNFASRESNIGGAGLRRFLIPVIPFCLAYQEEFRQHAEARS